ncbi:DUF202 domain-containing protein [Pseudanabaena sp. FACHB-2040]|uniref:YidH family protein n=1 Tax=Pseudanabaena sp. FACHB-2040 TaxID=2692859 RepID=UPI0016872A9A|nr:DUF202 domain-containing protein [Pseudanabaena sp. FACHB-2040]MBD2259448.1 DUF202 domain-containing protein [Pseudanabaena sp. FACHB-2040]
MTPLGPESIDWQAELARERNRVAAERTLLAWIRTSTILISFGFGIDQGAVALQARFSETINPVRLGYSLGLTFVGLGTFTVIMAALDHCQEMQRLQQPEYQYASRPPLGATVAVALLVIGIGAFVGIALKAAVF